MAAGGNAPVRSPRGIGTAPRGWRRCAAPPRSLLGSATASCLSKPEAPVWKQIELLEHDADLLAKRPQRGSVRSGVLDIRMTPGTIAVRELVSGITVRDSSPDAAPQGKSKSECVCNRGRGPYFASHPRPPNASC